MPARFTAAEIARRLGGELIGDGSLLLTGFAPADAARSGDLTFAENEKYLARAEDSAATAVLVPVTYASTRKTLIRVPSARVAFAQVLPLFFPERLPAPGVHPTAQIHPSARVDPSASIGPHVVIEEGVRIGARSALRGGNHIGEDCVLGEDVQLFPNVVLYPRTQVGNRVRIHAGTVIGADGFGYVLHEGRHLKVPQVGNVILHDDVEIGANSGVDRGALGSTIVGKGTKIDNLVQVGHNTILGEHCILCGGVGVAGSTKVGDHTTIAGQVGLAGHIRIGNNVTVGAQAGVMTDIPDGERWLGSPAQPDREMKRILIGLQRLPELLMRVSKMERQLAPRGEKPPASPG